MYPEVGALPHRKLRVLDHEEKLLYCWRGWGGGQVAGGDMDMTVLWSNYCQLRKAVENMAR